MDLKKIAAFSCGLSALILVSGCASSLTFRLAELCDYDRITQAECLDRNARADEAYRSDIERILNER